MKVRIPASLYALDDRRIGKPGPAINMKTLDVPQSGKAGTFVTYQTRYGTVRRGYVVPYDPHTPIQLLRRRAMGQARFLWGTLTDPQRLAWSVAAGGRRTQRRLAKSGRLSGYLLFIKINCNLALVNRPMVFDPPRTPQFGASPVGELLITNDCGLITIKLRVFGKLAHPILVLGTKPRSPGVSYVDHFAILGLLPAPVRGLSDITRLFRARYPDLRAGTRVFIQTVQQIDGWETLPVQVCALVPHA